MKNLYQIALTLLLVAVNCYVHAQVGIGTTTPDASAQLDVTSNSKGVLIPRMTFTERENISNAVEGLLIYQTTVPVGFYYHTGGQWVRLVNSEETRPAVIPSLYASNTSIGLIGVEEQAGTSIPLPNNQKMTTGYFSVNQNSTNVTIAESGRYQISCGVRFTALLIFKIGVAINGNPHPASVKSYLFPSITPTDFSTSFIVDLSANDTVSLMFYGASGEGTVFLAADGGTYMSILKLE